jgi:hypothetical protein
MPDAKDLTPHDQVCISLKVPQSDKPWLNELIMESRDRDMLQAAFVSMSAKIKTPDGSPINTDTHIHEKMQKAAIAFAYDLIDRSKNR